MAKPRAMAGAVAARRAAAIAERCKNMIVEPGEKLVMVRVGVGREIRFVRGICGWSDLGSVRWLDGYGTPRFRPRIGQLQGAHEKHVTELLCVS